jgi:hypothetical protein
MAHCSAATAKSSRPLAISFITLSRCFRSSEMRMPPHEPIATTPMRLGVLMRRAAKVKESALRSVVEARQRRTLHTTPQK